jgi:hypothetical protein
MFGELTIKQIEEEIKSEASGSDSVVLARRMIGVLSKASSEVANEIKKFETGKLKAHEDPESVLLSKMLPDVLMPVVKMLRILKRNGVTLDGLS